MLAVIIRFWFLMLWKHIGCTCPIYIENSLVEKKRRSAPTKKKGHPQMQLLAH